MKTIKYVMYTGLLVFVAAGISACSQEKQAQATAGEATSADAEPISFTMYKNPNCACCDRWATYMEKNGFSVTVKPSDQLASIKDKNGVPGNLRACHTALIDGYVVEGHVPVEAINKLLKERPDVKGVAVPGMPAQSPGMAEVPGPVDVYFFNGPDQVAYFNKF